MPQIQMFYDAHRRIAECNDLFLELVDQGLTREELEQIVERNPQMLARFATLKHTLPSARAAQ